MRSNGQRLGYIRTRSGKRTAGSGALLLFALLLALLPGSALAAVEHFKSFGPDGTEASDFQRIDSIALDQQDEFVYVLAGAQSSPVGTLSKFGPDGEPVDFEGTSPYIDENRITGLEPFAISPGSNPYGSSQVAVSPVSKAIYVAEPDAIRAFEADGEPAEFTAGPGKDTSEIPGFTELVSVAVDANGTIYASDNDAGKVSVFASTGALLTSFSITNPLTVAVDAAGAVYVQEGSQAIKRFTPSPFPVTGATTYSAAPFVSASGGGAYVGLDVDRDNGDVYVLESTFNKTWLRRHDTTGALVESFGAPGTPTESSVLGGASESIAVWGQAKEIAPGETVKLYVGDRDVQSNPPTSKVALLGSAIVIGPPEIENTSVLDVTADSAKLRAWVDPNTAETTYHFEYGLEDCAVSACTSVPLVDVSVGDGEDPVEVSHPIFDLQPDTTYHYRVVAENSLGPPTVGEGRIFKTQPLGFGFELIDDRAWEMVSPPNKHGAMLKGARSNAAGGLIQAASDGEGLAYLSLGSIEPGPQGNRSWERSTVLARRGNGGWSSKDIALPNHEAIPPGGEMEGEYKFFTPDLSRAIAMPRGATLLSPTASERTPYLREHGDPAAYTPLVTGKEGFANVPSGTVFGGGELDTFPKVNPIGATPDLSHVVLRSELSVPLVAGFPVPAGDPRSLYFWRAGELQPISVLPAGEGGSMASLPSLGSDQTTVQNSISADGSRVFWGQLAAGSGGTLYVRDTLAEETVRLDVVQGGAGTGGASPVFQGASADGTVVFFKDTRDLTADASPTGRDLYRCEIPPGNPAAGCASLTNLSAPLPGSGESADVLGMVSGLSEDGTRIYFVAKGVLDNTPNQYGDSAQAGEPNLYLFEEGEGTRFVATLDEEDKGTWGARGAASALFGEAAKLTAALSPSGRHLAFMSQRSLTGNANIDASTGKPLQEVFRYDAATDDLQCVSCNPFGAAPEGEAPVNRPLVNPQDQYGVQTAATLPGAFKNELLLALYRPRTALDNGRVFFNAIDSLVPGDSNGEWDVYQWEPTGVGDCTTSSGDTATIRSAGGCVSLLSSGTAEEEAGFLDASPTGEDVFFLTPARLSVTDEDEELDIYDARVNGVPATLEPDTECLGEACQPAVVAPDDPTPASAGFRGQGDPKPEARKRCAKGKRLVRRGGKARCVVRKQSRKGKASKGRRASR